MNTQPDVIGLLRPGDCMLYRPDSFVGWWISVKTWTRVSHAEIYVGHGMSVGSRDGLGVNKYLTRYNGLGFILRPDGPFNFETSWNWFKTVQGQKYDFAGLLCFYLAAASGSKDRMFCSEFVTRFYRAGGFHPVSDWIDADHVAPSTLLQSPAFDMVWCDEPN